MENKKKKPRSNIKRNFSEISDNASSDSEWELTNRKNFPKFLVIETLEEKKISELSPFLIEKILSPNNPKTIKKMKNGNLLVEVENYKNAQNLLGLGKFHTYKCKVYAHEKLNTSKGIIRSHELTLATTEEIKIALKKQGVIDHVRINIKRNGQSIPTNTYILTFNTPTIPKEIKIGYLIEKVDQYIPIPLRCFKCHKFGHHRETCRGHKVCGKCAENEPNHTEEECSNEAKCSNCHENHPAYSKTCKTFKKQREITEVKYNRNISFPEARKIVESYQKANTYAEVTQKPNQSNQTNMQDLFKLIAELKNLIQTLIMTQKEINKDQIITSTKIKTSSQNQEQISKSKSKSNQLNQEKQINPLIPLDNSYNISETEDHEGKNLHHKSQSINQNNNNKNKHKVTSHTTSEQTKSTKEKIPPTEAEPSTKHESQRTTVTTSNRFQSLKVMEVENVTPETNKETNNKPKPIKDEPKQTSQARSRSTSSSKPPEPETPRSRSRSGPEPKERKKTSTKNRTASPSRMEVEEREPDEMMDTDDQQKSEKKKTTKGKTTPNQIINHGTKNNPMELSRFKSKS